MIPCSFILCGYVTVLKFYDYSWVNKGRKGELSGVGTYNPDLVALQTEVRQLKKQLAAAEMEREILKKAAYFARDTLPTTRS